MSTEYMKTGKTDNQIHLDPPKDYEDFLNRAKQTHP